MYPAPPSGQSPLSSPGTVEVEVLVLLPMHLLAFEPLGAPAEPAGGESVEETIRMLKDMGFDDENRIRRLERDRRSVDHGVAMGGQAFPLLMTPTWVAKPCFAARHGF